MRPLVLLLTGGLLLPSLGWGQQPSATATVIAHEIRPEEIPERADELLRRLKAAGPGPTVEARMAEIENEAATLGREVTHEIEQATAALERQASFGDLEDRRRGLAGHLQTIAKWKKEVDAEAERVAAILDDSEEAARLWSATGSRQETVAAGEAVMERVREVRAALEHTESRLGTWRTRVLDLSNRLIKHRAAIDAVVEQLRAAAAREGENLLVPDSAPWWRRDLATQIRADLPQAPAALRDYAEATAAYVRANPGPFVLQALLSALIMLGLGAVVRGRRLREGTAAAETAQILERPYAIAILLGLLVTPVLQPLAPRKVRQLLGAIALIPTARILLRISTRANTAFFSALLVLLLLDRIGLALGPLPALSRLAFMVTLATGIGIALWFMRRVGDDRDAKGLHRATRLVAWTLALALLAELGGWSTLASILGRGVLAGVVTALYVYVSVITVESLLAHAWASPLLQRSRLVADNLRLLDRLTHRGVRWLGAAFWLHIWLTSIGLRDLAADGVSTALQTGVSVGALSVSLGGVLAFALTLVAAFMAARFINAVLEAEVYPRTYLPRGLPYALSTLVRYGIYLLGFLFALAAAGVQLGQVTVLIGGLGIGIGLGLQDLVKDFAAGLTLLLERRVHVGDAIQSGDKEISGRVLAIGMRSTIVHNWNGAEVVVPNATLLTGLVTNWTLSDRLVRLEVPVGVAYGTDPDRVVALLLGVAGSVDHIVANPKPQALFVGFGDSSLDFVLRAWTDEGYDRFAATTSELALAIHRALIAANITIPFPQRDLHLMSVAPEVRSALGGREKA